MLGHSAGEMAASYISGALSLEDAVRVTFHRSRLQYRTAGQGAMLAVGISREEATDWSNATRVPFRSRPSTAPIRSRSPAMPRCSPKSTRRSTRPDVFSRALQVDVPYHSPKMEQLEAELMDCLRDIRPRPASTPFFSTVTGTALDGIRNRCAVLVPEHPAAGAVPRHDRKDSSTQGTRCSSRSAHIPS